MLRWLALVCCVLLLWYWWQCYTLVEFGGGLLAQRPSPPRLLVVHLGSPVDDVSYTVLGSPTVTPTFIDQVLSAYGSPAAGSGQALYDLGVQYEIDPVYALSFFLHEDSFGGTGIGAANHSLGNIRCSAGYPCQSGFRLSSLGMSYPPLLVKVSQSRTGQDMRILELAPGLLSKGEGQLISRKGEQVSEFAHQIGFRQSLGCKRDGGLTAC